MAAEKSLVLNLDEIQGQWPFVWHSRKDCFVVEMFCNCVVELESGVLRISQAPDSPSELGSVNRLSHLS